MQTIAQVSVTSQGYYSLLIHRIMIIYVLYVSVEFLHSEMLRYSRVGIFLWPKRKKLRSIQLEISSHYEVYNVSKSILADETLFSGRRSEKRSPCLAA